MQNIETRYREEKRMRLYEIQNDWWIPDCDSDGFDFDRELFELREWWCRPRQMTRQLELPLEITEELPRAPF